MHGGPPHSISPLDKSLFWLQCVLNGCYTSINLISQEFFFGWVYCVCNGHFMHGTNMSHFWPWCKTLTMGIATLVQHHQHGYYNILHSQGSTKHILVEQLGSESKTPQLCCTMISPVLGW